MERFSIYTKLFTDSNGTTLTGTCASTAYQCNASSTSQNTTNSFAATANVTCSGATATGTKGTTTSAYYSCNVAASTTAVGIACAGNRTATCTTEGVTLTSSQGGTCGSTAASCNLTSQIANATTCGGSKTSTCNGTTITMTSTCAHTSNGCSYYPSYYACSVQLSQSCRISSSWLLHGNWEPLPMRVSDCIVTGSETSTSTCGRSGCRVDLYYYSCPNMSFGRCNLGASSCESLYYNAISGAYRDYNHNGSTFTTWQFTYSDSEFYAYNSYNISLLSAFGCSISKNTNKWPESDEILLDYCSTTSSSYFYYAIKDINETVYSANGCSTNICSNISYYTTNYTFSSNWKSYSTTYAAVGLKSLKSYQAIYTVNNVVYSRNYSITYTDSQINPKQSLY